MTRENSVISIFNKIKKGIKDFLFVNEDDIEFEFIGNSIKFNFEEFGNVIEFQYERDYRLVYGHENKKEFYIVNENNVIFHGEFLQKEHLLAFMRPESFGEGQVINYHYAFQNNNNKYVFYELKGKKGKKTDFCYIVDIHGARVGFELEAYTTNKELIKDAFYKLKFRKVEQDIRP